VAKSKKAQSPEGLIARNKRASFDYELGERYEAGLVLQGSEVKTLRHGTADLTDSWCALDKGEAYLMGVGIPVLPGTPFPHEAKRPRKLLLHAGEIDELARAVQREGMTVVATMIYFKGGRAKVEVAVAQGKKKGDKRQALRAKDAEREARQAIARGRKDD
jgi:SsrA-binding protein